MDDVDWRPGDDLDERLVHALGAGVMLGSWRTAGSSRQHPPLREATGDEPSWRELYQGRLHLAADRAFRVV